MTQSITKHFRELMFTVVATPHTYHVDYKIYDTFGYSWHEGSFDKPVYPLAEGGLSDITGDLGKAEMYIHGSVKCDGCSNWHFDEQDRLMLHGCCKSDVQRFGDILAICWDWTSELCLSWNASEAVG